METRNEIWKDIEGWEGYYQVSNFGRVRSVDRVVEKRTYKGTIYGRFYKSQIIKTFPNNAGYESVSLHRNGEQHPIDVHILVAKGFVQGYKDGMQVNHIDENKTNNNAYNLEWVSAKENVNKSTLIKRYVEKLKKPVLQLSYDGKILRKFDSIRQAALFTGLHKANIRNVCKSKWGCKSAGGYRWRFAED